MNWLPGAIRKPISRNYSRGRRTTRGVILHVAVSEQPSLHGYFNTPGVNASSHFYVRRDGTVEQYVSGADWSWTSGAASSSTIGVETQGMGAGKWTPQQVESLARICAWAHKTYGVPLQAMRSSKSTERGIGYHAQGVAKNQTQKTKGISQTGGQLWSKAIGKTCPGPERVKQVPEVIARAKQLVEGKGSAPAPSTPREENEDDMPKLTDKIDLGAAAKDVLGRDDITYGGATQYAAAGGWEAMKRLPRIEATLKAQAAAIEALAKSQGVDPKAVERAVEKAVNDALKDIEITLSVSD